MKIASVTPIFVCENLVKIGPTGTNRQTDGQIETLIYVLLYAFIEKLLFQITS